MSVLFLQVDDMVGPSMITATNPSDACMHAYAQYCRPEYRPKNPRDNISKKSLHACGMAPLSFTTKNQDIIRDRLILDITYYYLPYSYSSRLYATAFHCDHINNLTSLEYAYSLSYLKRILTYIHIISAHRNILRNNRLLLHIAQLLTGDGRLPVVALHFDPFMQNSSPRTSFLLQR